MDTAIQQHLRHVVRTLRGTPAPDTRAAARRAALLDVLDAYAERGRYPGWSRPIASRPRRSLPPRFFDGPGARAPRFRDRDGTWCAVGHLMARTDPVLADEIAETYGPCWLDEMRDPRLAAWAAAHGFTVAELAWIQPGYCWQPPVCDEIVVDEPVAPTDESCQGADPRFHGDAWGAEFCQECDGPFRVWANVQNAGTEVTEVAVELWGPNGVLDRVDGLTIDPGGVVQVELTTTSVLDVGTLGGIRMVPVADCDPSGSEVQIWDYGNGGPGWVLPDACGGSCDTGSPVGDTADDDTDAADEDDPDDAGCGCSSTGGQLPWGALLGLGMLVRWRTEGERTRQGVESGCASA